MNAAIGVAMLLVGNFVLPDVDDRTPRLHESMSLQSEQTAQDDQLNYTTRQRGMKLPRVPSLGANDDYVGNDRYRGSSYQQSMPQGSATATNRGASASSGMIPLPPTDPGAAGGFGGGMGGGGMNGGAMGGGAMGGGVGYQRTVGGQTPGAYKSYNPADNGSSVGGNQFNPSVNNSAVGQFRAPSVSSNTSSYQQAPTLGNFRAPTVSNVISQGSYGASSGPSNYTAGNTSVPDGRPFANVNPLGNAYSPYLNLYTQRTNNGTIDPYHRAVLPALQQQQFNNQVNGQIQNMPNRYQPRAYGPGGGQEIQLGNGMASPSQFINYGNFNNTGSYYPQQNP